MTKKDVEIGSVYRMNHSSGIVDVKILREKTRTTISGYNGPRSMTHWIAENLKTGREIEIKSAAKLLRKVS